MRDRETLSWSKVARDDASACRPETTGRAWRAMRASDRVATHQRRCPDRCGVTTCDRSRGCVRRASPKFRLSRNSRPSCLHLRYPPPLAVVISGGQRRNEDSTGVVIEDIDCSWLTTPWLFDSEYVVRQARHSRVLFTRVSLRHGGSRAYKSQRVRSRRKTI